jgi:hypothetical protein
MALGLCLKECNKVTCFKNVKQCNIIMKDWSFQGFQMAGNGLRVPRVLPAGMIGFNLSRDRFAITLGMAGLP